jgi:hypothetical protein
VGSAEVGLHKTTTLEVPGRGQTPTLLLPDWDIGTMLALNFIAGAHPEMKDSGWSRQPSAFSYQQKHWDPVQLADG